MTTGFFNSAPGDTTAADGGQMVFFRDDGPTGVIQAGSTNNTNSGGGSGGSFDDAYDPNLVYSSAGVLAMAKSQQRRQRLRSSSSPTRRNPYDFRYTIIGYMVRGDALRQDDCGRSDDQELDDQHVAAQQPRVHRQRLGHQRHHGRRAGAVRPGDGDGRPDVYGRLDRDATATWSTQISPTISVTVVAPTTTDEPYLNRLPIPPITTKTGQQNLAEALSYVIPAAPRRFLPTTKARRPTAR